MHRRRLLLVAAAAVVALALAGCAGDDPSDQPDTASTVPTDTGVAPTVPTGTGAAAETGETAAAPADLAGTAAAIETELNATLADLREVESLDELRADLEAAAASVRSWRERLAAPPEDDELADERAELDEALEGLETTFDDLSAQADEAGPADLGELARLLTPDSLEGIDETRSALDALLEPTG